MSSRAASEARETRRREREEAEIKGWDEQTRGELHARWNQKVAYYRYNAGLGSKCKEYKVQRYQGRAGCQEAEASLPSLRVAPW